MTTEQLDEIEKLLAVFWDGSTPYNPKLGVEIADRALPLVKALREARSRRDSLQGLVDEYAGAARDWRIAKDTVAQQRDEARAEVERLRAALSCPFYVAGHHFCGECSIFVGEDC